jgi:hypothetical protein
VKQKITDSDAIIWKENDGWLGYLRDHPDYWTQGEDLDDLRDHLRDLHADITSGNVPGIPAQENG